MGAVEQDDGRAGPLAEVVEPDPLDLDELPARWIGGLRPPDLLVAVELQGAEGDGEQRKDGDGDRHGAAGADRRPAARRHTRTLRRSRPSTTTGGV